MQSAKALVRPRAVELALEGRVGLVGGVLELQLSARGSRGRSRVDRGVWRNGVDREAPGGGRRIGMSEVIGGARRECVGAVAEARVGLRQGGAVREASGRRASVALEGRVGLAGGVGEAWAVVGRARGPLVMLVSGG